MGHDLEVNEDSIHLDPEAGIFVVADGMGGRPGGDTASRMAMERFVELCISAPEVPDAEGFRHIIGEVNRRVRELAQDDQVLTGMGTTLSAIIVDGDRGTLVHVGDSRIFLFRDDDLRQLTTDHTVEAEFRVESPDTAAELNPRVAGMLTRTIGTEENVDPEIRIIELQGGDSLLLATDGITKVLTITEIRDTLCGLRTESAETKCTRLFQAAQEKTLLDDTTLGVVTVLNPPS